MATNTENNMNTKLSKLNTSGYKGVSYNKRCKKWSAFIAHNKTKMNLGYFDNKEDAIRARVNKAKLIFGDFINQCEKTPEELKELEELEELDKELTKIYNK